MFKNLKSIVFASAPIGYAVSHLSTNSLLRSYGGDITLPLGGYFLIDSFVENKRLAGLLTFLTPSILELLQKVDPSRGTYDPHDFIAYGVGTVLAFTVDNLVDGDLNLGPFKGD